MTGLFAGTFYWQLCRNDKSEWTATIEAYRDPVDTIKPGDIVDVVLTESSTGCEFAGKAFVAWVVEGVKVDALDTKRYELKGVTPLVITERVNDG